VLRENQAYILDFFFFFFFPMAMFMFLGV